MLRVVPNQYIPRTDHVCDYECFKHIRPDGIEVVFQRGMEVEMFGQVGYIYTSVYDNKIISAHVTLQEQRLIHSQVIVRNARLLHVMW